MNFEALYPLDESFKICETLRCDQSMLRPDNIKVVGQFNKEFIWCRILQPSVVLCFDQHAVHERIRYDRLLKDSFKPDDRRRLASRVLRPPYVMKVFASHRILIEKAARLLEDIFSLGVQLLPSKSDTEFIKVAIHRIPTAFIDFENEGVFADYLNQVASNFEIIDGHHVQLNKSVDNIKPLTKLLVRQLQTRACHGAIRFGDHLSRPVMKEMIKALAACRMSFRCAHGRLLVMSALHIPNEEENANDNSFAGIEVDVVNKEEQN